MPFFIKRFIDDYFFLWNGTKEELEQFIEHFNTAHPTIKVTAEFNFTAYTWYKIIQTNAAIEEMHDTFYFGGEIKYPNWHKFP